MEFVDGKVFFLFVFNCKIFRICQSTVMKRKLIWIICYWFSLKQVYFVFVFSSFLVCAIRDVHKYGYVHNDLKLDNFMVREREIFFFYIFFFFLLLLDSLECKLIDFGLAREEEKSHTGLRGTSFFWVC
jgi:serine/threonine protein kinase